MAGNQKGVLLIQLGTPDEPTTEASRRYLKEFLMDPLVIDIPTIARAALVYGIISPFRSPKTAHAYQTIWTKEGSPLRVESIKVVQALQSELGSSYLVKLGMRYGNPSIETALNEFEREDVRDLLLFPLYPQYSDATTRSSLEKVYEVLEKWKNRPKISIAAPFYKDTGYIDAAVEAAGGSEVLKFDHVLFSFHGLPTRQILKADASKAHCLQFLDCCLVSTSSNSFCYRHHCVQTATAIAQKLGLKKERWSFAFQSRLGRADWIKPYTESELKRLAEAGVKKLGVFCPSFVADCLETLEEIGMRGADAFKSYGGESLSLLPCPNHHPRWISALKSMVQNGRA